MFGINATTATSHESITPKKSINANTRSNSCEELIIQNPSPVVQRKVKQLKLSIRKLTAEEHLIKGKQLLNGTGIHKKDVGSGAYHVIEAATLGLAEAQHLLGAMFDHGTGVQPSREKTILWLKEAAKQNYMPAINYLRFFPEANKS